MTARVSRSIIHMSRSALQQTDTGIINFHFVIKSMETGQIYRVQIDSYYFLIVFNSK